MCWKKNGVLKIENNKNKSNKKPNKKYNNNNNNRQVSNGTNREKFFQFQSEVTFVH